MKLRLLLGALLLPLALQAETLVISGADVHTVGPRGTLHNASVVIEDGRIVAVGRNLPVPDGARVIDAAGKVVTPGLFSPLGQIGLTEVGAVSGTVDFIQRGREFAVAFDIADAFNPASSLVAVNRIEGITRAGIVPAASSPDEYGNTSHVFSGLGALVNLGGSLAPVMKRRAMLVIYLGESGGELAGGSRAAALQAVRTALADARDYAQHRDAYDSRDRRDYSLSHADLEALQPVLAGDIPVVVHVDRASDIRALLAVQAEFGLRVIVAGGAEAWLVADELAAAGVGVILDAVNNLPASFDELNARLDSAVLLSEAGVTVAFGGASSMRNHNARNLAQAAGIAVANGLTWEAALEAITRAPAELLGVADRVGSIEAGKLADIVIWPADPLELTNYPERVFIEGREMPMQSRQTLLRDRYLQRDAAVPPAFRP